MCIIVIQSVQFKASRHLKEFVNEKAGKLLEMDPSIIRIEITLFEGASGNPGNQFCEIRLSLPGDNLFVKKNSQSFENSVVRAVHAMQKILRRQKSRVISSRKKTGSPKIRIK